MLHRTTVDVGVKAQSFETMLLEPAIVTNNGTSPSFMEHVMAGHVVLKAKEDMAGTVVESDFDVTVYMLQLPLRSVVKLQSIMRSEIERALADLGEVRKTGIQAIVHNQLVE